MVQIRQRILIAAAFAAACVPSPAAPRFYPDDPIERVPPPMNVPNAERRKLNDIYDYMYMTFGKPGQRSERERGEYIRAMSANTVGEVPDSEWYTNRHRTRRMTIDEMVRGPGNRTHPSRKGKWRVVSAKVEGVTPGFTVEDPEGRRYQLKFDSPANYELGTGADVMGSKFFYALGYNVPENYIVYFPREQLTADPKATFVDNKGRQRNITEADIDDILGKSPKRQDGTYRAVASLFVPGKPMGPFRYHGTRADDPNDIIPHEHRRELRAIQVFGAWLNHTDSKSLNTHDSLIEENGKRFFRHYLLDFSAMFGTDAFEPKSARNGHVYLLDWPAAAQRFFTLGLWVSDWERAEYRHVKGAGRIEAEVFDPVEWKSNYFNPAFVNCLPDDAFWAAKQVMAFTEPEIRALVATSEYSDKAAVEYLVGVLRERQRKIGEAYFGAVLPLDNMRVENEQLTFDDLAVKHGFAQPRAITAEWFRLDNSSGGRSALNSSGLKVPNDAGEFIVATLRGGDARKTLNVYFRRSGTTWRTVGIERNW